MNEAHASQEVPLALIRGLLCNHLDDATATLTDVVAEPITSFGVSGNIIYRVQVAWNSQQQGGAGRTEWIVKRWRPGAHSEAELSLTHSVEALAWQHGLLRRSPRNPLTEGLVIPFIGVQVDRDEHESWIVMEDIETELEAYSRAHPRPVEEATARLKHILEHLARFHAYWERPPQQARLQAATWLLPLEDVLWKSAATYAVALDEAIKGGKAKGRSVDEALRSEVWAFLDWLPTADQKLWQELMCDRSALVAAFQELPQTLLHGDLDDRNIGLRQSSGPDEAADLLLIDWEWMGLGPPALDVAKLLHQFIVMCRPSPTLLDSYFELLEELPTFYFERYVAAGGQTNDPALWRRALGLSLIKEHLTPLPHVIGSLSLAAQAETSSHAIPGMVVDEVGLILQFAERSIANVTEEMRRWL